MGKIIYKGVGYGGGGNSNTDDFVDVDQILSSGTKIATINIIKAFSEESQLLSSF